METAIGVFASRELGQDAMRQLIEQKVPHESIIFLSRKEPEAKTFCKHLGATIGAYVGAAGGMSAGVGAAVLFCSFVHVANIRPGLWFSDAAGFSRRCGRRGYWRRCGPRLQRCKISQ